MKENSYISNLHRQLDEKSKYLKFNDLISYHPETSVEYGLKEKVACLVSKWYNEHLETCQIEIDERHKCDYPLAVLLPVVLKSISNSKLIYIDSEDEGTKDIQLNSNSDIAQECYSHGVASELEKLCPIWQGEFNDILHVNTCSTDNVISLIGLNKVSIENAIKFTGFTPNTDGEHFLSLIHDLKFDQLRHYIANLINIPLTYEIIVIKYNFFGSEALIIKLLRKFRLSNDVYSTTVKCYSCCDTFDASLQVGSFTKVTSTLQDCIDKKMILANCKRCQSDKSKLELLSGHFQNIPTIFVIELGHISESNCTLKMGDIDESIYIANNERTLCYRLAGYTLSIGNHFYLMIYQNGVWYKYNDLLSPKISEWEKNTTFGKLNSVFYLLHPELCI